MKTLKIACTALILLAGTFAAACSSDTETEAADRVEIDGRVVPVCSGEASVRGLYGYR